MLFNILDQVIRESQSFRPASIEAVFALQLAKHLDDEPRTREWVSLVSKYGVRRVAEGYRVCRHAGQCRGEDVSARVLSNAPLLSFRMPNRPLLAFRFSRRSVALAVFYGTELKYSFIRELESKPSDAVKGTAAFVNRALSHFPGGFAAIEVPSDAGTQREELTRLGIELIRCGGVPMCTVAQSELLEEFGYPPLKARADLRSIAATIWSELPVKHRNRTILDAAATGLFVTIKQLLEGEVESVAVV